jgi:hypothetical protein
MGLWSLVFEIFAYTKAKSGQLFLHVILETILRDGQASKRRIDGTC